MQILNIKYCWILQFGELRTFAKWGIIGQEMNELKIIVQVKFRLYLYMKSLNLLHYMGHKYLPCVTLVSYN